MSHNHSISQIKQEEEICLNCQATNFDGLVLECNHIFCIKCLAFMYHKFQKFLNHKSHIKCLNCQQITELEVQQLTMIEQFVKENILPHLLKHEQSVQMSTSKKMMKSQQNSIQKVASNRIFYSKCESPNAESKHYCHTHKENITFICNTCPSNLLCIKCCNQKQKHHRGHQVTSVEKARDNMMAKIGFDVIEAKQQIQHLNLWKKRINQRKKFSQQKKHEYQGKIRQAFNDFIEKIRDKQTQLLNECSIQLHEWSQQISIHEKKIDFKIDLLTAKQFQLKEAIEEINNIEFIKKVTHTFERCQRAKNIVLDFDIFEKAYLPDKSIIEDISKLGDLLHGLNFQYRIGNFTRTITMIENSKSDEKLFGKQEQPTTTQHNKRVKTNMMSLNSSRDKKDKKCTKTEQDQRRNKSKANYKTESSKVLKVNKNITPNYLYNPNDKLNIKQFTISPQLYIDPMHGSFKSTSKILSKSNLPSFPTEEKKKKKKDNSAIIRERVERKTQGKQHRENIKKRKVHF